MKNGNVVNFTKQQVIEQEAVAWLIKLDGDDLSSEDLTSLRKWLDANPKAHSEALNKLAVLWDKFNLLTELSVPLAKPVVSVKRPTSFRLRWFATVVSSIVVAILLMSQLSFKANQNLLRNNGLYATAVGQQKNTVLTDGSAVLLNTNSQIEVEYSAEFRDIRLLQGEAHFTVSKDKSRPFRVFADNSQILAVGTAFSVHLKAQAVDVTVTEGSVSFASLAYSDVNELKPSESNEPVYEKGKLSAKPEIATISAGQSAAISRNLVADGLASGKYLIQAIETMEPSEIARRLSWRKGVLTFNGESLASVVEEVSRYTRIKIDIPDREVQEIKIGGRFPVGETDTMFKLLENNFNLRVKRVSHNHVLLTSGSN